MTIERRTSRVKLPYSPQVVEVGADAALEEVTADEVVYTTVVEAIVLWLASCTPSVTVVGAAVWSIVCSEAFQG